MIMSRLRSCLFRTLLCALLLTIAVTGRSAALEDAGGAYPTRPIRLIVGLPAGGTADILSRIIANAWGEALGQHVIVQNMPGATTLIAADVAARATPDGHTLFLRSNFHAELAAHLSPSRTYDMLKPFVPISLAWSTPNVLVVRPSLNVQTVRELLEYARTYPGKLNYASAGVWSSTHVGMELLKKRTGIDLLHVPYKGAPDMISDLARGDVAVSYFNVPVALPHIRSERMRPLAVTSKTRLPQLGTIPTLAESGYPELEFTIWVGIMAPASVSASALSRLSDTLVSTLKRPEVKTRLAVQGAQATPGTRSEFARLQAAEVAAWTPILKQLGAGK